MQPTFQTSFIPKKPITVNQTGGPPVIHRLNIFSVISTILFIVVVLTWGGLFMYERILKNQIDTADSELNAARAAFETDKIQDIIDANTRIITAKDLLENHVAVSETLALLQELTLKKVRFSDFQYINKNNSPSLSMKIEAQGYNALAVQGDVFSENQFIKDYKFFDFTVGDNGFITASVISSLNPSLVSYKRTVNSSTNQ